MPWRISRAASSLALVVLAALVLASAARANTPRYASPGGSGTACTSASPCSIQNAINGSGPNPTANGDEVIVASGTYGAVTPLSSSLSDGGKNLKIHGAFGSARPVIKSAAAGNGLVVTGASTVSHMEIDFTGTLDGLLQSGGTARRMFVKASGPGSVACAVYTSLKDSLCLAVGQAGAAIHLTWSGPGVGATTLRGVTAIATGPSGYAILASANALGSLQVTATNTIAKGTVKDVRAESLNAGASASVTLDHSDYATTSVSAASATVTAPGAATNKVTAPAFVNAAANNFHVTPLSVTVGSGAADPPGEDDLDGRPRTLGPTPDMGAYELPVGPLVLVQPPTNVTSTTATFVATADAEGLPTTVAFSYGPVGGTSHLTAPTTVGGLSPVTVTRAVTGLTPNTHYTVVAIATNSAGSLTSIPAQKFTTLPAAFTGVVIRTRLARLSHGKASISLGCPAGIVGPCTARLKLSAGKKLGTAGKGTLKIRAGHRHALAVSISRKVRKRLKRGSIKVKATVTAHDGAGHTKTTTRTIKLELSS